MRKLSPLASQLSGIGPVDRLVHLVRTISYEIDLTIMVLTFGGPGKPGSGGKGPAHAPVHASFRERMTGAAVRAEVEHQEILSMIVSGWPPSPLMPPAGTGAAA
jgi:hypothetical protein